MLEVIMHTFGLCTDHHPTVLGILVEYPQINPVFNLRSYYINKLKTWRFNR